MKTKKFEREETALAAYFKCVGKNAQQPDSAMTEVMRDGRVKLSNIGGLLATVHPNGRIVAADGAVIREGGAA